jgi:formamidopyrimidine-DNA glycosylase
VAGVGNIYADESLYVAQIHPAVPANVLEAKSAERLRKALARIMTAAVERRGSSIRNYLDGNGNRGNYQGEFRVYGRFGELCHRCRSPIERIRLAGRSTHFCPKCQK